MKLEIWANAIFDELICKLRATFVSTDTQNHTKNKEQKGTEFLEHLFDSKLDLNSLGKKLF